jgi:hypothetical protein
VEGSYVKILFQISLEGSVENEYVAFNRAWRRRNVLFPF